MSIQPEYFEYLDHFGQTVTLRRFVEDDRTPDMVALRHDVDYDLDLALEMAYWEAERKIRASYYLLHTADYWNDPHLRDKCLQLQDFGHEVGLHLNILTEWMSGKTDDPASSLKQIIRPLQEAGVQICGVSSHGDRLCYEKGYINYWCFCELRPDDPPTAESGLSAEGTIAEGEQYSIAYPESHQLVRTDGKTFNLWSVSMAELGIAYEAARLPCDAYYTDSGGEWSRTKDPKGENLRKGRHQVLMHPVHWRGPQRVYFFLSTARSGSKWLINILDKATPLTAQHEFSLNHIFKDGKLIEEKRTASGFVDLVANKTESEQLLIQSRSWIEQIPRDYAEANVYLERFLTKIEDIFSDATLIHLHRDPRDVVRSILNRDWYDTPEDNRHPIMDVSGFRKLTPFQKACWYVRKTNESLLGSCQSRISFERMITDADYLAQTLRDLKIPLFKRLIATEFDKKINANPRSEFPEYDNWTDELKSSFHDICDPVNSALDYDYRKDFSPSPAPMSTRLVRLVRRIVGDVRDLFPKQRHKTVFDADFHDSFLGSCFSKGCRMEPGKDGLGIIPKGERHAYVLFGGRGWSSISWKKGWKAENRCFFRGKLEAEIEGGNFVELFCLMYNKRGKLIAKRSLGRINKHRKSLTFSFKMRSGAKRFNLAVFLSMSCLPEKLNLNRIHVEMLPL